MYLQKYIYIHMYMLQYTIRGLFVHMHMYVCIYVFMYFSLQSILVNDLHMKISFFMLVYLFTAIHI